MASTAFRRMAAGSDSEKPIIALGFGPPKPKVDDGPTESEIAAAEGIISAMKAGDARTLARMLKEARKD